MNPSICASVLSGGGARGAYQAGVMRGLYEISHEINDLSLFANLCGVSAGAINVAYLASRADDLDTGTMQLCEIWRNLTAEHVFRTDYSSVTRNAFKLVRSVSLGGLSQKLRPSTIGLLNTKPLEDLLDTHVDFAKIRWNLDSHNLRTVTLSATDYETAMGITFVQTNEEFIHWSSDNRLSQNATLTRDHVMASSSIPIFFPPIEVNDRFYGDGSLRNSAPLSPAIHLGAEKIFVVGVRAWSHAKYGEPVRMEPSLGRVLSVLMNAIFLDSVESDLERLRLLNESIEQMHKANVQTPLKQVRTFYIHPSKDLAEVAHDQRDDLPAIIRFLFEGLGSPEESAELLSYLLFEPKYCSTLVELGYLDTLQQKAKILEFMST